jgi:hypothetical protein
LPRSSGDATPVCSEEGNKRGGEKAKAEGKKRARSPSPARGFAAAAQYADARFSGFKSAKDCPEGRAFGGVALVAGERDPKRLKVHDTAEGKEQERVTADEKESGKQDQPVNNRGESVRNEEHDEDDEDADTGCTVDLRKL